MDSAPRVPNSQRPLTKIRGFSSSSFEVSQYASSQSEEILAHFPMGLSRLTGGFQLTSVPHIEGNNPTVAKTDRRFLSVGSASDFAWY